QTYGEHLQPGQELSTVVCTDPEVDIAADLAKASTLLWRVQGRRGLVEYKDREYSTTAVVGVEFTKQDIQKRDIKGEAEGARVRGIFLYSGTIAAVQQSPIMLP